MSEIRSTMMAVEAYHRNWCTGRHRSAERPEATYVHTILRQTIFFQPDVRTPGDA